MKRNLKEELDRLYSEAKSISVKYNRMSPTSRSKHYKRWRQITEESQEIRDKMYGVEKPIFSS